MPLFLTLAGLYTSLEFSIFLHACSRCSQMGASTYHSNHLSHWSKFFCQRPLRHFMIANVIWKRSDHSFRIWDDKGYLNNPGWAVGIVQGWTGTPLMFEGRAYWYILMSTWVGVATTRNANRAKLFCKWPGEGTATSCVLTVKLSPETDVETNAISDVSGIYHKARKKSTVITVSRLIAGIFPVSWKKLLFRFLIMIANISIRVQRQREHE